MTQLAWDSSAVLAWVFQERGWSVVDEMIRRAHTGEVTLILPGPVLTEVAYQAKRQGNATRVRDIAERLLAQGFVVEQSESSDLIHAAELLEASSHYAGQNNRGQNHRGQRAARLSLGDALILATVSRIGCPIVTRDRYWLDLVDAGIVNARVRLL